VWRAPNYVRAKFLDRGCFAEFPSALPAPPAPPRRARRLPKLLRRGHSGPNMRWGIAACLVAALAATSVLAHGEGAHGLLRKGHRCGNDHPSVATSLNRTAVVERPQTYHSRQDVARRRGLVDRVQVYPGVTFITAAEANEAGIAEYIRITVRAPRSTQNTACRSRRRALPAPRAPATLAAPHATSASVFLARAATPGPLARRSCGMWCMRETRRRPPRATPPSAAQRARCMTTRPAALG
jgi:hypothetical protein